MANPLIITLYFFMWYLLVTIAILYTISDIDDLFFDLTYWIRYAIRWWKLRKAPKLTYEKLAHEPEKPIAIMVACWHEAGIIEQMLQHNTYAIDYQNYTMFVGVYPNDPETIASVKKISDINPHVQCVIGPNPGPTTKADNLDSLYHYLQHYQQQHHIEYQIFVMHDSEDVIHPLSLKLYNYLIPRKDMIQTPVFPWKVPLHKFTHWSYADEFSEIHLKDIIVRESIRGLVPSAGVGTAFSRRAMNALCEINHGEPFARTTLTEDYNTALQLRLRDLKQIFVMQYVYRLVKKKPWYLFGKTVERREKEYIATRALFPMEYKKAVRQKARWITGISIQGWLHSGWAGDLRVKYTLLHDRKTFFAYIINIFGYIIFLFWLIYQIFTYFKPEYPSLQEQLNKHPWVWYLIIFCTIVMIERLIQKMIAVYRVYGLAPALLSLPRSFYSNFINLHATLRAYGTYLFHCQNSKGKVPELKWDKTDHHYPIEKLPNPKQEKLGDILIHEKRMDRQELTSALDEQMRTGKPLGKILIERGIITAAELAKILAIQSGSTS